MTPLHELQPLRRGNPAGATCRSRSIRSAMLMSYWDRPGFTAAASYSQARRELPAILSLRATAA